MSRQDPSPLRQASRPQTYADLVAERLSVPEINTLCAEHSYCRTCEDYVELDDGCCGCGAVIDEAAFEEADKRLAELNADPDAALYAAADYYSDWARS